MHRNDGPPLYARPWDGTLPLPGEVSVLRGDVRQPGLGLDGESLAEMVRGLDLIIHSAAATGFNLSERVYREVNIGGTANVLALIGQRRQAPIPLLHLARPEAVLWGKSRFSADFKTDGDLMVSAA